MAGEHSSGIKFVENDNIKGYVILKAFDPGGFAFAGKAKSPSGRTVFFKNTSVLVEPPRGIKDLSHTKLN